VVGDGVPILVIAVTASGRGCGVISEPSQRGIPVLLVERDGVVVVADDADRGRRGFA